MKKICLIIIAVLAAIDLVLAGSYFSLTRQEKKVDPHAERVIFETYDTIAGVVADLAGDSAGDPLAVIPERTEAQGPLTILTDVLAGFRKESTRSTGIDVSSYQGKIDWEQVAQSGIDFAMIRLGYRSLDQGLLCEDSRAIENLEGAVNAGLKIGVYFGSSAINKEEVLEEASWVLSMIEGYPITYPVAYDAEGFTLESCRMKDLSAEERTELAQIFLKKVYGEGYRAMIYGSKYDLENFYEAEKIDPHFYVWVAQYPQKEVDASSRSDYKGTYDMWQYTDQASVPGIGSAVDLNTAFFSFDKEEKAKNPAARGNITVSDQIADSNYSEVNEQVTPKIRVNLRLAPTTRVAENIYTTIDRGTILTRVGQSANGWSRIAYDGKVLYCVTSYLMNAADLNDPNTVQTEPQQGEANTVTEYGVVFDLTTMSVTPKIKTNLRSVPSAESDATLVATLYNGEWVECTGLGRNGWSRINYNGQVVYAVTNYLTTDSNYAPQTQAPETQSPAENPEGQPAEAPAEGTPAPENVPGAAQPNVEQGVNFVECNKQVTPKIEVNLRSEPSTAHDASIVVKITAGEVVTCTGESDNGWSRVIYNGQTLYGVTNYMQEAPAP